MALIKLGGGITDIRGSIGGTTFARNPGGNYARSRKKPVNPRSPLQNSRRAQVAYLTKYWSEHLTEQERTDWRAYAMGTTWTNRLGETIEINGLAAFIRLNTIIAVYGGPLRRGAPDAMGHAGGVTLTFLAENDTTKLQIDEPGGAFNKDILGHNMILSQGIPSQPGRIGIPKGFKYVGRLYGHHGVPLVFPYELAAAYTMAEGQLITIRGMFHDEHYRVSGPHFAQVAAAPSV